MEKEIKVGASELQKGAEGIREALNDILKDAQAKTHLITFVFNNQTSWFKVDLSKPDDAQVLYFNQAHRSLIAPLKVVFEEFLSQFPKGNLIDWDRHNRVEHSIHETPFPNEFSKEFVEHSVRVDSTRYQELSVLSAGKVKAAIKPEPLSVNPQPVQGAAGTWFGMFRKAPEKQVPTPGNKEDKKPEGPTSRN